MYGHLLKAIASHRVGDRPGRSEPHAVKRRRKPYPLLTKPRDEARNELHGGGHLLKVVALVYTPPLFKYAVESYKRAYNINPVQNR